VELLEEAVGVFVGVFRVWPFLFASAALGLLGGLMSMSGRGWCGATLLLAATVGPLVLSQVFMVGIGVAGLGFAGLLSLFIRPTPPKRARVAGVAGAD
jgi:hypothetical protein